MNLPDQTLHQFPLTQELLNADPIALANEAQNRLNDIAPVTSLEYSESLSHHSNAVYIKRTDELPGKTFKYLSAMNSVAEIAETGNNELVIPTAGSYGIGVGYGVQEFGGKATAFVPVGSAQTKINAMRQLGVQVVEAGRNFDESLLVATTHSQKEEVELLHPFARLSNIGATALLGKELIEQQPDLTHLIVQYGGGSLTSGVAAVVKALRPDIQITAVQVEACTPFIDSVQSGEVCESSDSYNRGKSYFSGMGGIGVGKTHEMTLGLASQHVDRVASVSSTLVYAAMHDFAKSEGTLPEFAGAAGMAYARELAESQTIESANIGCFLTGANPQEYTKQYLEAKSRRRQLEKRYERQLVSS